jgi:hypothetical protein
VLARGSRAFVYSGLKMEMDETKYRIARKAASAYLTTNNQEFWGVSWVPGRQPGHLSIMCQGASERGSPCLLLGLVARVKALRRAVRVDNFRLAQRLRMGLVLYLRRLEEPFRNEIARLFEVSGLWVRNVGDRHYTKRQIQRISRHIIQRLDVRSDSWKSSGLSATAISTA